MRVSLQWLRELVACDLAAAELAERLSVAGFEVEEIEDLAARAAGVVVGYVESREPHPNADKLQVLARQLADEHGIKAWVEPADLAQPGAAARLVAVGAVVEAALADVRGDVGHQAGQGSGLDVMQAKLLKTR